MLVCGWGGLFGSLGGVVGWVLLGFWLVAAKLSTGGVFLVLPLVFPLICY